MAGKFWSHKGGFGFRGVDRSGVYGVDFSSVPRLQLVKDVPDSEVTAVPPQLVEAYEAIPVTATF